MRFYHYDTFPQNTIFGIYFHYLADSFMGHDIPTMKEMQDVPLGETEVEIENEKGETQQAICVTWMAENQKKGLIVLKTDEDSLQYARKCAKEKKEYI